MSPHLEDFCPSRPEGRSGYALGISSFVMNLDLTKTFFVLQKKIRFEYGFDEEIMERRERAMVMGPNLAVGEKSREVASPTVT